MNKKERKETEENKAKEKEENKEKSKKEFSGNYSDFSENNREFQEFTKMAADSSSLIEGIAYEILSSKDEKGLNSIEELSVPKQLLALLERFAVENKAIGYLGIEQLRKIKDLGVRIAFYGKEPSFYELKNTGLEDCDRISRQLAFDESALFLTTSKIQAKLAKAIGIKALFISPVARKKKLLLEKFFDLATMSVHLRENVKAYAKKGVPGKWAFEKCSNKALSQEQIQEISREIIEEAKLRKDAFIEIERPGSTIVQLDSYRIVITKPPFSDGWEITAVRPVKKLSLADYRLSEKLMKRISEQAEGILIAGSPGMGKSTFAAALAEHYSGMQKIVKTVEAPRDLVLPDKITQYAISHGDAQEIHDILLLSRPDYTFFDEMRNTEDFKLFADLRLAGIGFIGIVHATKPIDAIQRFVGRIELGVIPQVVDTVIFIKNGAIEKVLSLQMVVKVPAGMTEADLARPVVVVADFENKKPEYELYSYGEDTVVVPVVESTKKSPAMALAEKQIESEMQRYSKKAVVEMLSESKCIVYVPDKNISKIIGKQGKNIAEIEKQIGISIDIRPIESYEKKALEAAGQEIAYNVKIANKSIVFELDQKFADKQVNIAVNGDFLVNAMVSKKGIVKIKRTNKIGKIIADAVNTGDKLTITLTKA